MNNGSNGTIMKHYKGVYVYAQQVDNKLSGIAFELLGKAKELAAAFEHRSSCSI